MKTITIFQKSQEILSTFKQLFVVDTMQWETLQSHTVFGYLCYYITAIQDAETSKEVIEMYCDVQEELNPNIHVQGIKSFIQNSFYSAKVIADSERGDASIKEIVEKHVTAIVKSNLWPDDEVVKQKATDLLMAFITFLSKGEEAKSPARQSYTGNTDCSEKAASMKTEKKLTSSNSRENGEIQTNSKRKSRKKKAITLGICIVAVLVVIGVGVMCLLNQSAPEGNTSKVDKYEGIDLSQYEHMLSDSDLHYVGMWVVKDIEEDGKSNAAGEENIDSKMFLKDNGLFTVKMDGTVSMEGSWISTDSEIEMTDAYDGTVHLVKIDGDTLVLAMEDGKNYVYEAPSLSHSKYIGEWKVVKYVLGGSEEFPAFPDGTVMQISSDGGCTVYRDGEVWDTCMWYETATGGFESSVMNADGNMIDYEASIGDNEMVVQIGNTKYYVER